jgi:acetyltransferase
MAQTYLASLFAPASIAVVGASERPGAVGTAVMQNLRAGPYRGALFAINPRHKRLYGERAYPTVAALPGPVDLAVIATPARHLPDIIRACAARGIRNAAIISAGLTDLQLQGRSVLEDVARLARSSGIRLLGPNSLGLMRSSIGMNATFSHATARPGTVAVVTQSGGLASAMLDWALTDGVGFSSVISLGNQLDIDVADALDFLALDPETESILLYLEGVPSARRFMSALRAAARIKPVLALKSGRAPAGSRAAFTHTGALMGADDVFDAALRRSGAVRVPTFLQLFAAAKCLASRYRPAERHLAIVTNGGGPGVMAADRAIDAGLALADLAPATIARLDRALPVGWSRRNPVDILEDAGVERYREAFDACIADPHVDGIVAILTPQAMTDAEAVAAALVAASEASTKQLIACWMGDQRVVEARRRLQAAQIPVFRSPEPAVEAFASVAAFYANQRLLMQVPGPLSHQPPPDLAAAKAVIESALAEGRRALSEMESKAVLAAFGIAAAQTHVARSASEAVRIAERLGFPVVMKVDSPDIAHKSDVGGVRLGVASGDQVRAAFAGIEAQVRAAEPGARIRGVAVERMIAKPHGRELLVGVARDAVFGPVITFGTGGVQTELIADRAVALPPLNQILARDLIDRTRVAGTLGPWRRMPPADRPALENLLLRVSEMVCELPWLVEMDLNPVILDETDAVVADARILVEPVGEMPAGRYLHMAICPYPSHLTEHWLDAQGRRFTIRAIRPEDAAMEQAFVRGLSAESRYFRFVNAIHELSDRMLVRFTQIDYDREMALVAVTGSDERQEQIAVARYAMNPDGTSCEFAIVIADAWQGQGLGTRLMTRLMDAARERGLPTMEGFVLATNHRMLRLMEKLGFEVRQADDDPTMKHVIRRLV